VTERFGLRDVAQFAVWTALATAFLVAGLSESRSVREVMQSGFDKLDEKFTTLILQLSAHDEHTEAEIGKIDARQRDTIGSVIDLKGRVDRIEKTEGQAHGAHKP
jgi:hypothetical protein